MTKKEFDTMGFHSKMKFKFIDSLTEPNLEMTIAGVDFESGIILMKNFPNWHYSEVELIQDTKPIQEGL